MEVLIMHVVILVEVTVSLAVMMMNLLGGDMTLGMLVCDSDSDGV